MIKRRRFWGLLSVIGLAMYASNLFVLFRENQWVLHLRPVQEVTSYMSQIMSSNNQTSVASILRNSSSTRHRRYSVLNDNGYAPNSLQIEHDNVSNFLYFQRENMSISLYLNNGNESNLISSKRKNISESLYLKHDNTSNSLHQKEVTKVTNETDTVTDDVVAYLNSINLYPDPTEFKKNLHKNQLDTLVHLHVLRRRRRLLKMKNKPYVHIAFLKVHKAYSTILQTMFFRYGFPRDLNFALPVKGNYFSKSTSSHEKLAVTHKGRPFDILCNHGYFNLSIYSSLLPQDSVYIGIVREPLQQFLASYDYYSTRFKFKYLTEIPKDSLKNLILYPEVYEEDWPLSYTMNSMAKDFGFQNFHYKEYRPENGYSSAQTYLQNLGIIFDLVLVSETLDESLVLMKRMLNWSMKDILYLKRNTFSEPQSIDKEVMEVFKDRNRLDYLIYDYFVDKLDKKIKEAGASLIKETKQFKRTVREVTAWCNDYFFGDFVVKATSWNDMFVINMHDCMLMSKSETDFINILRKI